MVSEVLSVKWNGHRNTFFEVLATAREKKTFCDATIACEGNLYPVHRFVISTCSTYFEKILEDISDTHPVIVLVDIKSKAIEDLLQYMYTGEIRVLQEDIDSLIKAGEVLKIKGIGVADEKEKCKKQKRLFNDSEERPEKRRRSDEFSDSSRLNESSRESKNNKEANSSSESCNEDINQKEIDGSLSPSDQLISEFTAVKEEIFQPNEDSSHFPEQNIKVELNESLMDEEDIPSADIDKFERTSDSAIEQEYDTFNSDHFHDASTSSISPDQKMHMDWLMQNEMKGHFQENRKMPLTGWCLVCGDRGSGYHYGIETCEGCNAFFKRSIRNNVGMEYSCVLGGDCDISKTSRGGRGTCKACRFNKCLTSGMNSNNARLDTWKAGANIYSKK